MNKKNIFRCIESVVNSTAKNISYEIIVVDNGSQDNTVALAKKAGASVYVDTGRNVSGLRNLGVGKSNYPLLAFLDADCEVPENWLQHAGMFLENSNIGVIGGYPLVPQIEKPSWIEKIMYPEFPMERRKVKYLGSCCMFVKKSVFMEVGGFEEDAVSGEDYILCQKIKKKGLDIVITPELSVQHYGYPKNIKQFYRREVWHGSGMIDLCREGKVTLPLVWSIVNIIILISLIIFLLLGKEEISIVLILMLLFFPLLASFQRMYRMRIKKNLLGLYIIFLVYGLARTISFAKTILNKN